MKRWMILLTCLILTTATLAAPPAVTAGEKPNYYLKLYKSPELGKVMGELRPYRQQIFTWRQLGQMYGSPAEATMFEKVYQDAMKLEGDLGKAYKTTDAKEVKRLVDRFTVLKMRVERVQKQVPAVLADVLKYRKESTRIQIEDFRKARADGRTPSKGEVKKLLAAYKDVLDRKFAAEQKALRRKIEFVRKDIERIEKRIAGRAKMKDQMLASAEKMLTYKPRPKTKRQLEAERKATQSRIDWMKKEIERLRKQLEQTQPK